MRVPSVYYIVFSCWIILQSCATVGSLSGGPVDSTAPKPIQDEISPPNGQTAFAGNQVVIPFDEYFSLNQPNLTVKMIPPDANVSASFKGKDLILSWEDTLQPHTTYAIYLNETIQDITERNDSVYQYVFSTGAVLDSIGYSISAVDAWSGAPLEGLIAGLYHKDSFQLKSFGITDKRGIANLNYLKAGNYQVVVFDDANNDLIPQEFERLGIKNETVVTLQSTDTDSIPYRVFSPKQEPNIRTLEYKLPGKLIVGANYPLVNTSFYADGSLISDKQIERVTDDSLFIFFKDSNLKTLDLVAISDTLTDSLSVRIPSKGNRTVQITPSISSLSYSPWDSLTFYTNDLIQGSYRDSIRITNKEDSTAVQYQIALNKQSFSLLINRDSVSSIIVEFSNGAIETLNGFSVKKSFVVELQKARKFGSLNVDLTPYENSPVIIEVNKGKNSIRSYSFTNCPKQLLIEGLAPGDVHFTIIRDLNNNGVWDVGSLESRTLPEPVVQFSNPIKVRANWEVEVSIVPTNE